MNAIKILEKGNKAMLDVLKDFPAEYATKGIATGTWTAKDVFNHTAMYELKQADRVKKVLDPNYQAPVYDDKNDLTWEQLLKKYDENYAALKALVESVPSETLSKPDSTDWYGDICSLDDTIVLYYGHKRHHIA